MKAAAPTPGPKSAAPATPAAIAAAAISGLGRGLPSSSLK